MKKNILLSAIVCSVFCLVLFAGAGLVQAAAVDKGMMMDNGQLLIDKGQMMIDKGKIMSSKGMKTEGTLMMRDGRLLVRHGKAMQKSASTGKKMVPKHYTPEKDFKGWLESDKDGG
jgi:hypothetical protein